jgi:hypothetical protein
LAIFIGACYGVSVDGIVLIYYIYFDPNSLLRVSVTNLTSEACTSLRIRSRVSWVLPAFAAASIDEQHRNRVEIDPFPVASFLVSADAST